MLIRIVEVGWDSDFVFKNSWFEVGWWGVGDEFGDGFAHFANNDFFFGSLNLDKKFGKIGFGLVNVD